MTMMLGEEGALTKKIKNGPYYVLKRTEHYEIVAEIPSEKEDINGSTC